MQLNLKINLNLHLGRIIILLIVMTACNKQHIEDYFHNNYISLWLRNTEHCVERAMGNKLIFCIAGGLFSHIRRKWRKS